MKIYKVIYDVRAEQLEQEMNEYAKEGYEYKGCTTCYNEVIYIIMEKDENDKRKWFGFFK